ncbi:addiction module protein [Nannocystis radixulma]|uniref:Addiction module protein n=1 Tax=Nannocystis radixulma TaxID=2995305 RepID=A0ABT5BMP2_9BACT|nr:addiction module protein [Nannocystis radixulma]MDC0674272.1 addiction module protein [Nannocystis radixulma]
MTSDSFAGGPPRILTDADEVTLAKALKRRLAELDRGEVELIPADQVLREVFGSPSPQKKRKNARTSR